MKRWLIGITLLGGLLWGMAGSVWAQSYSFQVPQETVNVYWESDGTESIDYVIVFANDQGASPIDFVDVAVPNSAYSLSNVTADVDGHAISDIQKSAYVQIGVALGLGQYAIPPGASGTVHVLISGVRRVLYPDSQDSNYASAVFSPTRFDSSLVHGRTDLTVTFHLPPGVQPDEPRYHRATSPFPAQPDTVLDDEGRVAYTWHSTTANSATQYTFGASFPAKYVPKGALVTTSLFDQLGSWASDASGFCVPGCCVAIFVGLFGLSTWSGQRRKMEYLPPKISIEGHGIKRGLTAVEAAVLMEQPLDKVLTMILFAVLKKGAASVTSREPLALKVTQPLPAGLYDYERDFAQAFLGKEQRAGLQALMVKLIKSVSEKMKGFSRKESVAYYQSIIETAWQQVQTAATPEVKGQKFDEVMDWTMLDRDFAGRSRQVFGAGPIFVPTWWGRYNLPAGPTISTGLPAGTMGGALPHLPGSDFAASLANGIQHFSSDVVGNLTNFTSNVTQATNPLPKPATSSYRGGGGGGGRSCACACACAGCACACAGGGR
jgi:hypothetical protein